MAKKQPNTNVNQSFLQTVVISLTKDNKVILKEIKIPTTVNVPLHLIKDITISHLII